MNKFFTKVCSVGLILGAIAGLATAGKSLISPPDSTGTQRITTATTPPQRAAGDVVWESNFNSTGLTGYTVINNSGNSETWHTETGNDCKESEVCIKTWQDKPTNDWLITPGIELTGGQTYKLQFTARSRSNQYPESVEVKYGTSNIVSGMTNDIANLTSIMVQMLSEDGANKEYNITPQTSGTYYFGFHSTTPDPNNGYYLYVGSIKVIESAGGGTPEPEVPEVEPADVPWTATFGADLAGLGYTIEQGTKTPDTHKWQYDSDRQCPIIYSYRNSKGYQLDDWLITPGIKMEAGKVYDIDYLAGSTNGSEDSMEVKIGTEAKSSAMTTTLLSNQSISYNSGNGKEYSNSFSPTKTGVYYIGFHATTNNQWALYLKSLKVTEAVRGYGAPQKVTNAELKPGTEEDAEALVMRYRCTIPTKDLNGDDMQGKLKLKIYEWDNLLYTAEDVTAGQDFEWTRPFENSGWNGYGTKFIVYNDDKASEAFEIFQSYFVGHVAPATPRNIKVEATANRGEVKTSWDAVTTNSDGDPIADDLTVTYDVYKVINWNSTLIAEGISETEYTFQAFETEGQGEVKVKVVANDGKAKSSQGESQTGAYVGFPYNGITGEFSDYAWDVEDSNGWVNINTTDLYAHFYAYSANIELSLLSGFVSLADYQNPVLKFNVKGYNSSIKVSVLDIDAADAEWTVVSDYKTVSEYGGDANNNGSVTADLSAFGGKTIRFKVTSKAPSSYEYTYVSGFRTEEYKEYVPTLPYEPNFADADERGAMTIINGKGNSDRTTPSTIEPDNFTWTCPSPSYTYWMINTEDSRSYDWLITPGLTLEEGKTYVVSFDTWSESNQEGGYRTELAVKYGKDKTDAAMTETICEPFTVLKKNGTYSKEVEITITETGKYYFGFLSHHGNSYELYLSNISIKEAEPKPVVPENPAHVKAARGGEAGEVTISWDEVESSTAGEEISGVTYKVEEHISGDTWETVADELTTASYTYTPADHEDYQFRIYRVTAILGENESEAVAMENPVFIGAVKDELNESFANGFGDNQWFLDRLHSNGNWAFNSDYSFDDDNHSLGIHIGDGPYTNVVYVYSGAYNLPEDATMYLSVSGLKTSGNPYVEVWYKDIDAEDANWSNLHGDVNLPSYETWYTTEKDLSALKGKNVQFMFKAANYGASADICLDKIMIYEPVAYDLTATVAEHPATAKAGTEFEVVVKVINHGASIIDGTENEDDFATVKLYRKDGDDATLVAEENVDYVSNERAIEVTLKVEMSKLQLEEVEYYAVVEYKNEKEAETANNTTASFFVAPEHNNFGAPTNLRAESVQYPGDDYQMVRLKWDHAEKADKPVVEDFESAGEETKEMYDSYAGWQFSHKGIMPPSNKWNNIAISQTVYVWNTNTDTHKNFTRNGFDNSTHSGDNFLIMLGSLSNTNRGIENWAVSPELSGKAQVISFWVNTCDATGYEEYLSVLYSTNYSNVNYMQECEEFTKVRVKHGWTKYTVTLPQGAKYFAFKHTDVSANESYNYSNYIVIDDVTFVPAETAAPADAPRRVAEYGGEHQSYNVYRDNELVETLEPTEATWHDADVALGENHTYHVTAVYQNEDNELVESKPAMLTAALTENVTTGVENVDMVIGLDDAIFTLDGVRVAREQVVSGNVYVVIRNGQPTKVVIR